MDLVAVVPEGGSGRRGRQVTSIRFILVARAHKEIG